MCSELRPLVGQLGPAADVLSLNLHEIFVLGCTKFENLR